MRLPSLIALATLSTLTFAGIRTSLADDPAPASPPAATAEEQARIKQLVENLGSDDFRVREGATKELIEMGEKARPALEAAMKSPLPEVRFRADQILRRLDGQNRVKRFDEEAPMGPARPGEAPGGDWAGPHMGGDMRKWVEDAERRMRELQEEMERRFGRGFMRPAGPFGRRHYHQDGTDLTITPRGATLSVTEKGADGVETTKTYEGKDLAAILDAHPELKDKPGVAAVREAARADEQNREAEANRPWGVPGFSMRTDSQGVVVQVTPGHAKVTVTEKGPDGKPVTKTYEGKDLEEIKRAHPELAGKLGGFEFRVGPDGAGEPHDGFKWNPPTPFPTPFGREIPLPDGLPQATPETGPFGLALQAVDATLRSHLGLGEGKGAVVAAVRADSDAAKMGFQVHDVITAVNGTEVSFADDATSVRTLLRNAKDGALSIDVRRAGRTVTLTR